MVNLRDIVIDFVVDFSDIFAVYGVESWYAFGWEIFLVDAHERVI